MLQIELESLRRDVTVLREAHARDIAALVAVKSARLVRTQDSARRRMQIDHILREPIR